MATGETTTLLHHHHHHSPEVKARARRRRRRVVVAVVLGIVVAAYTYGALVERVIAEDRNDLLPEWLEAVLLGTAFACGSLPVGWSIVARAIIPIPTLFLYLTVFLGKNPSLPFSAAFVMALVYAGALTVLADYLADRPDRARLGARQ
ncbi:MAG TPA: hypothetical protein VMU85_20075 [Stellaceae bacterium]|nr:hypothetical protein [Stellaceae bacterium]